MPATLIKIMSMYKSLPSAERRVADYISGNPEKTAIQSISALARNANVSIATISRFSRKLGYDNFKQFKVDFTQDLMPVDRTDSLYQAITSEDSDSDVIEKVFLGNIKSLEDTLKVQKQSDLKKVARLISQTQRLVFFGIGSSGNIANDAAIRFSMLDIQAEAYTASADILVQAVRIKKNDVVVGISHTGRSSIIIKALGLATAGGAETVGISNYSHSPLHHASETFFCTVFPENRVKMAALSSRIAQICTIDTIFLLTARYKENYETVETINQLGEDILRIPPKQ